MLPVMLLLGSAAVTLLLGYTTVAVLNWRRRAKSNQLGLCSQLDGFLYRVSEVLLTT